MSCSDGMGCESGACGTGGESSSFDVKINHPAPAFRNAVAYQKGKDGFTHLSLAEYRGKWVAFFFYPRDFTFICPTEIKGFEAHVADFKAMNCEIIACSTDSEWSHKNWFERDLAEVSYPIVADTTLEIARAYGVLSDDGSAERGLFIIDPEGMVKYILVSSGSVGRSVKETLRVLKAIQSGDLCPMEWEAGQKTLGKA